MKICYVQSKKSQSALLIISAVAETLVVTVALATPGDVSSLHD